MFMAGAMPTSITRSGKHAYALLAFSSPLPLTLPLLAQTLHYRSSSTSTSTLASTRAATGTTTHKYTTTTHSLLCNLSYHLRPTITPSPYIVTHLHVTYIQICHRT